MAIHEKINVEIISEQNVAIVNFQSAAICQSANITVIRDQVRAFVDKNQPANIIFDFENVKFFSSQLLGVLLDIRTRVNEYAGKVLITSINPQLYRVFKITNLNTIFQFYPDRQSAVNTIKIH